MCGSAALLVGLKSSSCFASLLALVHAAGCTVRVLSLSTGHRELEGLMDKSVSNKMESEGLVCRLHGV
eukprot:scaffold320826_cov17-Tisochrysis_lutea.AAC.1